MKGESRTIGQSRTFARGVCMRLEGTWQPSVGSLERYQHYFEAVRKARTRKAWAVFLRHGCSLARLMDRREKALAEALQGKK